MLQHGKHNGVGYVATVLKLTAKANFNPATSLAI